MIIPLPWSERIEAWLAKHVHHIPYIQFRFEFTTPTIAQRSWIRPEIWFERAHAIEKKHPSCRVYNTGINAFGLTIATGILFPSKPDT